MSCRGKALKFGRLFLMAILIEEKIPLRGWSCVGVGMAAIAMEAYWEGPLATSVSEHLQGKVNKFAVKAYANTR